MTNDGLPKARLHRMGEVMGGYAERGEIPGVVTLIARRTQVLVDVRT